MEKQESRIIKTFDKNAKLYKCCAVDEFRITMQSVYFKDGFAIASDGHILIKANLKEISEMNEDEIKNIDGKFLHSVCYKQLLKYKYMQIEEDGIIAFNNSYAKTKFIFVEYDCKYPDYNYILKQSFEKKNKDNNIINNISFRPELLNILCNSFPSHKGVPTLFLSENNESILVGFEGFYTVGLIMPCLQSDINIIKENIKSAL